MFKIVLFFSISLDKLKISLTRKKIRTSHNIIQMEYFFSWTKWYVVINKLTDATIGDIGIALISLIAFTNVSWSVG